MSTKNNEKITSFFYKKENEAKKDEQPQTVTNSSGNVESATSTTSSNISDETLPHIPYQPKSIKFPMRKIGKQKRSFNPKWFDQFQFLHYREDSDSVICHTCALADKQKLLKIDTRKEQTFIELGFTNWKKAIEKFRDHENSATHKHAIEVITRPIDIDELISHNAAIEKRENSRCLMKIIENVVFLGKQGLALRGDGDDKTGNFYQLVLLRAKDDPALLKWIEKSYDRHMTPQAQNEILKLLALSVLRKMAADIRESKCYSILADEASDVSNVEQLVLCLRWVTKDLIVEEDYIGLMPLDKANAANIAGAIKDVILRMSLSMEDAKAQCYDGCSTMTGVRNGVSTIIKRDNPKCLLTHCYCHALNLAVGDTVKNVPLLKETLEDAYELTKLIKYSPKRQAALKNKQQELKIDNLNLPVDSASPDTEEFSKLRLFCPTRWTVRAKALQSISSNYKAILEMLLWCTEPQNTSDSDIRARAGGIERKMNTFKFVYGMNLALLVLNHSDNLSATLQDPKLCAADTQKTAQLVVQTLSKLRDDEHAQKFLDKIKREVTRLEIDEQEPGLPRRKKAPRKLEAYFGYGTGDSHQHETAETYYRAQYFDAIDKVVASIRDRFDQPDYKIYVNLEQALLNGAANKNIEESLAVLKEHYKNDFDFTQLKIQLETLSTSFTQSSTDFNLADVLEHLRKLSPGQRLLMNQVFKLAQYCLVNPASNATSERAFSAMRRIKTYLRNTMSQNRLNHAMCLHVHRDKIEMVNLKSVLNEFIDSVDRRKLKFARM